MRHEDIYFGVSLGKISTSDQVTIETVLDIPLHTFVCVVRR